VRITILVAAALLVACGGKDAMLSGAVAPSFPPPPQGPAELSPVGPTTFDARPNDTTTIRVRATRADGGPVYFAAVAFHVQAGGGAVQPTLVWTDEQGFASAKWKFGPSAAVNIASAMSGGTTMPVSFTVSTFPSDGTGAH
jgi:hypothetical protein